MALKISRQFLQFLMAGMLIFGTLNTLVMKNQDLQSSIGINGKNQIFNHPFLQCFIMFFGEHIMIYQYIGYKQYNKKHQPTGESPLDIEKRKSGKRTKWNKIAFAAPAACDFFGSTCGLIGLALSTSSVQQMIISLQPALAAIFSIIFLKRKLQRHHWLGIVLVTIGVLIVALSSKDQTSARKPVVGIIFLIANAIFGAAQYIVEDYFISDYFVVPTQAVGLEGLFGMLFYIIALPIMYFIPCSDPTICGAGGSVENVQDGLLQIINNKVLLILVIGGVFTMSTYNAFGISITKNVSCVSRAVIDTARTILVWVLSLKAFGMEAIGGDEIFDQKQLIGFVLLAIGTPIQNEILIIPFLGFNKMVEKKFKVIDDTLQTSYINFDVLEEQNKLDQNVKNQGKDNLKDPLNQYDHLDNTRETSINSQNIF